MATPRSIAFHTLGCKLNYTETSQLADKFREQGYSVLSFEDAADIYVINTCSVTEFADKKCRQFVRRALRNNPGARIAVIGCYAQLKPAEIAEIEGVDLVLGASEKFALPQYINNLSEWHDKQQVNSGVIEEIAAYEPAAAFGDRTRAFLKVQDGCDYKCSFCTIPKARGKNRSPSPEVIKNMAADLLSKGAKEIVLTGVNVGDYKYEDLRLIDLLKDLEELEGNHRFRISSIEPNLLSGEIIDLVARSSHFMPHFHLPLQSGCDRILKRMRRRYNTALYCSRIEKIKEKMPHAGIGVDVIVGFPGETQEDFNQTYEFIDSLPVSYLHVFTYSARDNTPAAGMEDQVPMKVRKERNSKLRGLSAEKSKAFRIFQKGKKRPVLFEHCDGKSIWQGYSDNYIRIKKQSERPLENEILEVII